MQDFFSRLDFSINSPPARFRLSEFEGIVFGHFSPARIFHFRPGKSKILTIIYFLFPANPQNMEYKQEKRTLSTS